MENRPKKRRWRPTIGIRTKVLIAFIVLPLVSIAAFGYFALSDIRKIGEYALLSSTVLGESAATDSSRALEQLGETIIAQKAADVALQCKIFIDAHPGMTIEDLQHNREFRKIAVQPVGKTGYTILYEKSGIMRFHLNPELINFDMHNWRDKLPDFWHIFEKTFDGRPNSGYYDWQDVDGSIRRKFMAIVPVSGTPYMVAATTYIHEFSIPMEETKKKISEATRSINAHVNQMLDGIYVTFIHFIIIMVIAILVISFWLSRTITRPIVALTEGAKAIGRGELNYRVEVTTDDEFGTLARAFNRMASDLKEHMAELARTTADKESFRKELEIARRLQRRLLPDRPPSIPGYDIAADNLPAREVGGDFFDFIPMTEDRWGFVIADVSGKGITAAIFMGLSRTIVRATMTRTLDISSSLQQANDLICRDSTSGMFVTLFYAVPIPEERKLRYVNAGHNPPLLLRKGSDEMVALRGKGIALGVKQNIRLEENVIDIGPGDTLVLYTDGVTEAVNENGEAFGEERLKHAIRESRYATAREIILRIQDAVLAFSGTLPQFDDITLLVAKVK
ncbi:MAG TPA: SpoIIE family protein phosphatase [Syntrophales bacterium]|nr:SpoIIE family protein phosphatase [Syntrophobacterales bacterium]HRT70290.1 SpoIIE family protein phosphatase [Syntrophales bacterium]